MAKLTAHAERAKNSAAKRRRTLQALRDKGWSYQRIGKEKGISRQRVHQILKWGDGYKARKELYK